MCCGMSGNRSAQLQVLAIAVVTAAALTLIIRYDQPAGEATATSTWDAPPEGMVAGPGPAAPEPSTTTAPPTTERRATRNAFSDRVPRFPAAPPASPVTLDASQGAPLLHRVPTSDPVAFITIDDGLVAHPQAAELIEASGIPTSLFPIAGAAAENPGFIQGILDLGAALQTHTMSHAKLQGQSYDFQREEICGGAGQLATMFGQQPTLFRPPGGAYDQTTLRAAQDCGMTAVLHWSETVNDGAVQYQTGQQVRPGDIILMHFRDTFVEDFLAALDAVHAAGLTPARLEDYLVAS
jgi:peptidoglycan/xylan/chitin deacetylase (PgdA/CDA1 family)